MSEEVRKTEKKKQTKVFRVLEYALYLFAMVIPIMYLFRHEMLPDNVAFYVCSSAGFVGFTALLLEDLKKKEEVVLKLKKISNGLLWFSFFWATLLQGIVWEIIQFIKMILRS